MPSAKGGKAKGAGKAPAATAGKKQSKPKAILAPPRKSKSGAALVKTTGGKSSGSSSSSKSAVDSGNRMEVEINDDNNIDDTVHGKAGGDWPCPCCEWVNSESAAHCYMCDAKTPVGKVKVPEDNASVSNANNYADASASDSDPLAPDAPDDATSDIADPFDIQLDSPRRGGFNLNADSSESDDDSEEEAKQKNKRAMKQRKPRVLKTKEQKEKENAQKERKKEERRVAKEERDRKKEEKRKEREEKRLAKEAAEAAEAALTPEERAERARKREIEKYVNRLNLRNGSYGLLMGFYVEQKRQEAETAGDLKTEVVLSKQELCEVAQKYSDTQMIVDGDYDGWSSMTMTLEPKGFFRRHGRSSFSITEAGEYVIMCTIERFGEPRTSEQKPARVGSSHGGFKKTSHTSDSYGGGFGDSAGRKADGDLSDYVDSDFDSDYDPAPQGSRKSADSAPQTGNRDDDDVEPAPVSKSNSLGGFGSEPSDANKSWDFGNHRGGQSREFGGFGSGGGTSDRKNSYDNDGSGDENEDDDHDEDKDDDKSDWEGEGEANPGYEEWAERTTEKFTNTTLESLLGPPRVGHGMSEIDSYLDVLIEGVIEEVITQDWSSVPLPTVAQVLSNCVPSFSASSKPYPVLKDAELATLTGKLPAVLQNVVKDVVDAVRKEAPDDKQLHFSKYNRAVIAAAVGFCMHVPGISRFDRDGVLRRIQEEVANEIAGAPESSGLMNKTLLP